MNQGCRGKGSISRQRKFKSILGGWITFKKDKKENKQHLIKRYYIVNFDDTTGTSYVVSDVFKINTKNGICHSQMTTWPGQIINKETEILSCC